MSHVAKLGNRKLDTKLIHYLEDAVSRSTQSGSFFPRLKGDFIINGEVSMEGLRASEAYKTLVAAMADIKTLGQIDAAFTGKVADFVSAVTADAASNPTASFRDGSQVVGTLVNGMKSVVSNHRDMGAGLAA